ncbi:MAG: biotin/lipoyl-containing protein [Woeseiaceae bacterium]|nr:biotin/lipoyl-containing protein [Woeseiaceae bacterium]
MSEYIFKLPDLGEGTVESEIGEWHVKVGDSVAEEDIVGTMMTDKAAVEISSPVSGKVKKLAGEPGDIVPVGSPLVVFETGDAAAAADDDEQPADDTPAEQPAQAGQQYDTAAGEASGTQPAEKEAVAPAETGGRVMTSPAIRRRAKENDIDLAQVPGSGPGGRILRADFDRFLEHAGSTQPAAATRPVRESRETREIRVIGVRRMIAERMQAAKQEIPHFSYVEELDVRTRGPAPAPERKPQR